MGSLNPPNNHLGLEAHWVLSLFGLVFRSVQTLGILTGLKE